MLFKATSTVVGHSNPTRLAPIVLQQRQYYSFRVNSAVNNLTLQFSDSSMMA